MISLKETLDVFFSSKTLFIVDPVRLTMVLFKIFAYSQMNEISLFVKMKIINSTVRAIFRGELWGEGKGDVLLEKLGAKEERAGIF